jgi:molybdate transport system substrate-binding protein
MHVIRLMICLLLAAAGAGAAVAAQVRLFAAASLADALQELAPGFATATGHTVQLNFGGSGLLARQIRDGAPADVFFSADELRVDQLERDGFTVAGTRRMLLANSLVLIGPEQSNPVVMSFADLANPVVRRIAIGEPATVPAGTYAKEHLVKLQLWTAVGAKVVPLDNVRTVLAAVAAGNVDAGIVYHTDVLGAKGVRRIVAVPPTEGPRIVYPAVVIKGARDLEAAKALLDYLAVDPAQAVFMRHGFALLGN